MKLVAFGLLLASLVQASISAELPPGIKPCRLSDEQCIVNSAKNGFELFKKGIKEFKIPSIEPIKINHIYLEGTGRSIDIQQNFTDLEFQGLSNSTLLDAKVDLTNDKCRITFDFFNTKAKIEGQHYLVGRLIFFQMKGGGDFFIDFQRMNISNEIICKKVTKNGSTYIDITDFIMVFDFPEELLFYFENVVENNKELSDEINRVAAENWRELFGDIKENFAKGYAIAIRQYLERFFSKIPIDKLFIM